MKKATIKTNFLDKETRRMRWAGSEIVGEAERIEHLDGLGLLEDVQEVKEDSEAANRTTKEDKTSKKKK